MSIENIWKEYAPERINFSDFTRRARNMPDIATGKLSLQNSTGEDRKTDLQRCFYNGRVTTLLRYDKKPGQALSLDSEDEAQWQVTQVQGVGRKGYRVESSLDTPRLWAAVIESVIPKAKEAGVERIVIANPIDTEFIIEAGSESILERYKALAEALKMKYSEELRFFIRDL